MTRILVIGGGVAGELIAKRLKATLITASGSFVFPPLLPDALARPGLAQRKYHYPRILHGTVTAIDPKERTVTVDDKTHPYDVLVVATGARPTYSAPGSEEHATAFYTEEDMRAVRKESPGKRVLIVGGGPTGVEVAAELSSSASVTLLHGGAEVVPMWPARARRIARERLETLGVKVRTGVRVERLEKGLAHTTKGEVAFDICIWATGVRPQGPEPFAQGVPVQETLQHPDHPEIFAAGDCALTDAPLTAQAAQEEAAVVSRNVRRYLRGKSLRPYRYHEKGLMLGLGPTAILTTPLGSLHGRLPALLRRFYYRLQKLRY